jgi:hypothetical protein
MSKRATLLWVDAGGNSCLRVVTTATGVGAIESAMQLYTNPVVASCAEGVLDIYSAVPASGDYMSIYTTARIDFLSALGSRGSIYLPGPLTSIFSSTDASQVDPATITTLITACVGNLICGDGNVAATYGGSGIIRTNLNAIATLSNY